MPCSAWGSGDLCDLAAEPLDRLQGRLEDLAHAGLDPVPASSRGTAEAQPLQILAVGRLDPALDPDRGRVAGVAALHHREKQRRVGDVPGSGPHWSSEEAKAIIP